MEITAKTSSLLSTIQDFEVFQGIDPAALEWLIERSDYVCYDSGDFLFKPGQAADHMQVIVEGRYVVELNQNGEMREIGVWEKGYVTGVLPFSRMVENKGYGRALEKCCVLELHRKHFTEMVNVSYELTQALVSVMTTRVRDFTSMRFQNEKLMALGKLSAGLAHELNNPASAMVRDARALYNKLHATPENFKAIITMRVSPEQTDQVNAILFERLKNLHQLDLSSMERMDRMDELQDWLEDHGVEDPEEMAETFVEFALTIEDLERIEKIIDGQSVEPVMLWLEKTLSMEKLIQDIQESSQRIQELVTSVKKYSHMDRGVSMEEVDIHDGIRNTLAMLQHRLKKKQINVEKVFDADLPLISAYPGELNQVWTNLVSNAIDAMDHGGSLQIRTYRDRQYLCVDVIDSGSGIPEDDLTRIFDPFFTTKPMGEGTGLGLEIVKRIIDRHRADIQVESRPGRTRFRLCFPEKSGEARK